MQNGKGSKSRISNKKNFDSNFDQIEWESKGTKIAREARALCNRLSPEQRKELNEIGLKLIYSNKIEKIIKNE